jgi:hypothetical protein
MFMMVKNNPTRLSAAAALAVLFVLLTTFGSTAQEETIGGDPGLSTTAGPGLSSFASSGCDDGLRADDGSVEAGYRRFNFAGLQVGLLQQFTPPSYPYALSLGCICFTRTLNVASPSDPTNFVADVNYDLVIYQDAGGQPGAELARVSTTATSLPIFPAVQFYETGLSVTLSSGSVWIGAMWVPSNNRMYLCTDESDTTPVQPGLHSDDNGATWNTMSSHAPFANYNALMIRAAGGAGVAGSVPHLGMVQISTAQSQPFYSTPGGTIVRDADANEIRLPRDFDGSGADTYIVSAIRVIDEQVWIGMFLGSAQWAWVRLDGVTALTDLPIPQIEE